jgi:hypothetical protein
VKDVVKTDSVTDLQDLRNRISNAVSTTTPDMPERTRTDIDFRSDIIRGTRPAHVASIKKIPFFA